MKGDPQTVWIYLTIALDPEAKELIHGAGGGL